MGDESRPLRTPVPWGRERWRNGPQGLQPLKSCWRVIFLLEVDTETPCVQEAWQPWRDPDWGGGEKRALRPEICPCALLGRATPGSPSCLGLQSCLSLSAFPFCAPSFQHIPSYRPRVPRRRCTGGQLDPLSSQPEVPGRPGRLLGAGTKPCRPAPSVGRLRGNNSLVLRTHVLAAGGAGIGTCGTQRRAWHTQARAPPPPPHTPCAQMHSWPRAAEPLLSG